jgi:GIY-YIG catalytic domain-containing protein
MRKTNRFVGAYARMWPRAVFDHFGAGSTRKETLIETVELFDRAGVYVLYRDEVPYYVGQTDRLRRRIRYHANKPNSRYYNFWNFFSAFVIEDKATRDEIEGILIAAMPTANGVQPKLRREKFPKSVSNMIRQIRRANANPKE